MEVLMFVITLSGILLPYISRWNGRRRAGRIHREWRKQVRRFR